MCTLQKNKANKRKIFLCSLFFLPFFLANFVKADSIAEDFESLSKKVQEIINSFMESSFELRMGYEYRGGHLSPDAQSKLFKLSATAAGKLEKIIEKQQSLKNRIENYTGDDWDDRYGETGLWRRLATELYSTILSKCEIDFYLAGCLEQPQQNKTLKDILSKIDLANQMYDSKYLHLLKAKTSGQLSKTEPGYKLPAKKEFNSLKVHSDDTGAIAFRAELEEIKFFGPADAGQLKRLTRELSQSEYATDIKLILSLAFVRRQYEPDCFEQIVHIWPQTERFLGRMILSDISQQIAEGQNLQSITLFEAELAVLEAWKEDKGIPSYLAEHQRFQTPLILYIAGVTSTQTPVKSVEFLIKASSLPNSKRLKISPKQIAKQAARLSYNLFKANSIDCELTLKTFEYYREISKPKTDEELEYLYAVVLKDCGQITKAEEMLIKTVREDTENEKIRIKSIGLYCRLLIESDGKDSAEKILEVLTETDLIADANLNVFKSNALWRLGKPEESLKSFLLAIEDGRCQWADEGMGLLSEVIDRIDAYKEKDSFAQTMANCEKIAEFCLGCLGGPEPSLYLAEVIIFAENRAKYSVVDRLLAELEKIAGEATDLNLLRCQARFAGAEGKFNRAAGLWAKLRQIHKRQRDVTNKPGWKWWRAKYYELYYFSKTVKARRAGIFHTIEVLETSYSNIPSFWSKKLSLLKRDLADSIDN